MLLRQSQYKSNATFDDVLKLANNSRGKDEEGYRNEFIKLVANAQSLVKTKIHTTDDDDELVGKR